MSSTDKVFTLLQGDSSEKLQELEDNSIGSMVTDPPYLISFMGEDWDKEKDNIAGNKDFWALALKKLKPGAYGLVFGHSRTHHRVMIALEDAGFEIRDTMMWMYGQGFPKSQNIGKAVDKLQGNERAVVGTVKTNVGMKGGNFARGSQSGTIEVTKGTSNWEGWGTALKPAYEPIILVRKPLAKGLTIAKNCEEHNVGGINIDACKINGRFPANILLSHHSDCTKVGTSTETVIGGNKGKSGFVSGYEEGDYTEETKEVELWNCIDDCPCKELNTQAPLVGNAGSTTRKTKVEPTHGTYKATKEEGEDNG